MTPSKYVLKIREGFIELRVFGDGVPKTGSVIEGCVFRTGKSLPGIRRHGAKMAKRWKVPFIDETQETQS